MLTEQDLEVIAKVVVEKFQNGKFKAFLPPIRAEINTLKSVGSGYSLVDGKQGEVLTLLGLIPGKFINMRTVGRDIEISLAGLPKLDSVHIENLRGVSLKSPSENDLMIFQNGVWRSVSIDELSTIKELKLNRSYPEEDQSKLSRIEDGAQVNADAKEIKSQYESNPDTNPFTNRDKATLEDVSVKAHSHKNKEIIESYTETNDNVKKAVALAHIHPNQEVLNKIFSPGSGQIITDDERNGLKELIAMLPELRAILKTH